MKVLGKKLQLENLKIIDEAAENDAVVSVLWDQRVFNDKEFPTYSEFYVQIIEYCLDKKARFMTHAEYIDIQNNRQ